MYSLTLVTGEAATNSWSGTEEFNWYFPSSSGFLNRVVAPSRTPFFADVVTAITGLAGVGLVVAYLGVGGKPPLAEKNSDFFFNELFQWFFIELSVLHQVF